MRHYLVNLLHNIGAGFEMQTSHPVTVLEGETLPDVITELIEGQYVKRDAPVKSIYIGTSFYDGTISCCMNDCTLITQEQFNFLKSIL